MRRSEAPGLRNGYHLSSAHQTFALGKEKLGKGHHLDGKQLQHTPPQPRRGQWSPWGISKTNRVVPHHAGTGGYMSTTGLILRPFPQPWSGEGRLPHQTGVRVQGAEFSLFDLRSQHLEEHLCALTMCEKNTTPPTQKHKDRRSPAAEWEEFTLVLSV